jgi:hypothetical protein
MDRRLGLAIAGLSVAVVVLSVALTIVVLRDDGGTVATAQMPMGGGYMGMMQAMGGMDSDAMLSHMRDVLGDEDYARMLAHLEEHRRGGPMTRHPEVDEMMHRMFDGMLELMPADRGGVMPMRPR